MVKAETIIRAGNKDIVVRSRKGVRRLSLRVYPDGRIILTKPVRISLSAAVDFLQKHTGWIQERADALGKKPAPLLGHLSRRDYLKHKEFARALVHARIAHYNSTQRFPVKTVRIGSQTTRWGSCSAKGNLNFNYKIVFLPRALQDYVVVHELAHLIELNHSDRFWNLVAEYVPNWKALRQTLRKY